MLVELPERSRQLVARVPKPVQVQLHKLSKRSLRLTFEIFAGLLVVGAVALGLAYQRLNQGPISVAFLVPSIETAINRELAEVEVQIDDAVLQRSQKGAGVLFRLRNIRVLDRNGSVVAQAPWAAIGLSGRALLWGRIAPGSVDFIGPRLLLYYSPEDGLALTFSRNAAGAARQAALNAFTPQSKPGEEIDAPLNIFSLPDRPARPEGAERQIDLTKTLTSAFERVRGGDTASSFLTRFGVRNAVVVFDQHGKQSFWRVPDFAIDLEHRETRSILEGEALIESAAGPWRFEFRTEQSDKQHRLTFTALVRDLIPKGLAANFPTITALQAMNLPLSGETSIDLATSGELLGADARLRVAAGHVTPPWDPKHPMLVDEGDLNVRYVAREDRIEVLPSTLLWGGSRLTVSGEFRAIAPEGGAKRWQFKLKALDTVLVAEEFGLPPLKVDEWVAEGTVTPDAGRLVLSRFLVRAGQARIEVAGTVTDAPGSPAVQLEGRVSPMPLQVLMQFWPKFIAGSAREWVGERVKAGSITGGAVKIDLPAGLLAQLREGAEVPDTAFAMDLNLTGLEIQYVTELPPVHTGAARLSIRGCRFNLDVPQGQVTLPSGQQIALSEGRMSIDDLRLDPQKGEIAFKAKSSATTMAELLDMDPLGYAKAVGMSPSDIGGQAEAALQLTLPMTEELTFADIKLRGTARIDDAVVDAGVERARIEGGSITFNVTERALQATGDVQVGGVPAKLSWQRFFDAPASKQPDLRLAMVLDDAARQRLGNNLKHIIRGRVPLVVSVGQGAAGKSKVSVEADLTDADLILSNVGWRKPPGRAATLRYRMVEAEDGTTELQDFRIVGDDIAIDGWIALNAANEPTAFYFNDFSFNLITHIEMAGKIRPDKVWEVRASGATYDGRQFFKSLFSSGKLAEDVPEASGEGGNLDLTARIGSMVGYFDTTAQDVTITLKKRGGLLHELNASGKLNGQAPIAVRLDPAAPGQPRVLLGESKDAGSAFRLVGFYPRVEGGEASLQVNLDGDASRSKTGVLWARDFVILGDRVVGQVLSDAENDPINAYRVPGQRRPRRQRIVFNQLKVPFAVGGGRFVLNDSYINGPLLGATLRGQVDFATQQVDLGGTYIPFYGLNSALGSIPIIGNLLVGRRGEGVVGITFAIQGPTSDPNVLVNPVSVVAPGIFRQIFEFNGGTPTSTLPPGSALPPPAGRPAPQRLAPSN